MKDKTTHVWWTVYLERRKGHPAIESKSFLKRDEARGFMRRMNTKREIEKCTLIRISPIGRGRVSARIVR